MKYFIPPLVIAFIFFAGLTVFRHSKKDSLPAGASSVLNYCADNTSAQKIIVSIKMRHMWACQKNKIVYNNPVVTGMAMYASDVTPTGTYKIYAKLTNQELTGSDASGNWDDHVTYWMPFLQNKYGTYGFHDATWRKNSEFGNISSSSKNASHGCVEMPLSAAKWLYSWVKVRTSVLIES